MMGHSRHCEVMDALRRHVALHGRMPTTKQLCHQLGMQRTVLQRILNAFVERGQLQKLQTGTLLYQITENSRVTPSPASAEREKAAPAQSTPRAGAAAFAEAPR